MLLVLVIGPPIGSTTYFTIRLWLLFLMRLHCTELRVLLMMFHVWRDLIHLGQHVRVAVLIPVRRPALHLHLHWCHLLTISLILYLDIKRFAHILSSKVWLSIICMMIICMIIFYPLLACLKMRYPSSI